MSRASQRHKFETQNAGLAAVFTTTTITLLPGLYPSGIGWQAGGVGDVATLSAAGRSAISVDQDALATAIAATIDGLTGFTASAVGAVITVGFEAPNGALVAPTLEMYLG